MKIPKKYESFTRDLLTWLTWFVMVMLMVVISHFLQLPKATNFLLCAIGVGAFMIAREIVTNEYLDYDQLDDLNDIE